MKESFLCNLRVMHCRIVQVKRGFFSFFASFFLFSKEKKKRNSLRNRLAAVAMKESLHRLTAVPLPFQGRLICQRRKKIKVAHLHKKTLEYQHYQYRQGQPPALASPRRTARYERIPPDGFDMAALEVTLCGGTPPPPNGGSPPLSGEAICKLANAV